MPESDYEQKFAELIKGLSDMEPKDVLFIHHPQVIGDSYQELVESLNRIADAKVHLSIVPRSDR